MPNKWIAVLTGKQNRLYILLLFIFFFMAYILPLGIRYLVIPDETRYAEIPREMIATGDWVVPRLDGLRYFEKPVMGYWVHACSILLFGENNFAVRLPSALAVGLSTLLIYLLLRSVPPTNNKEDNFPAVFASLIFLSCFEVFGVGNTAVLDNLFSFFLTATIVGFFFATETEVGSTKEKGFLLLSGIFCGLAFLTKGFLALAVPVLVLVPYLIGQRRYMDLLRMSWLPILTAVLVSLPWGILVHLRAPDFWHYFFWNEHVRRFLAENAQHKESFWYFFIAAPVMFMPWTLLIPAAGVGLIQSDSEKNRKNRMIWFACCWLVLPFLFFSFSNGKLLTYILPCFPPFAILTALGIQHYLTKEGDRKIFFQAGVLGNAILFSLLLVVLLFVQHRSFDGIPLYSGKEKPILAAIGFLVFIIFCLKAYRVQQTRHKILFLGFAPLCLFSLLSFLIPDPTIESKMPGVFLQQHVQQIGKNSIVIADEHVIRAVTWYLKRSDIYVLGAPKELQYGLSYQDAAGRLLDKETAIDLINKNPGRVVLIAEKKLLVPWRHLLPKPVIQDQSRYGRYVLLIWSGNGDK